MYIKRMIFSLGFLIYSYICWGKSIFFYGRRCTYRERWGWEMGFANWFTLPIEITLNSTKNEFIVTSGIWGCLCLVTDSLDENAKGIHFNGVLLLLFSHASQLVKSSHASSKEGKKKREYNKEPDMSFLFFSLLSRVIPLYFHFILSKEQIPGQQKDFRSQNERELLTNSPPPPSFSFNSCLYHGSWDLKCILFSHSKFPYIFPISNTILKYIRDVYAPGVCMYSVLYVRECVLSTLFERIIKLGNGHVLVDNSSGASNQRNDIFPFFFRLKQTFTCEWCAVIGIQFFSQPFAERHRLSEFLSSNISSEVCPF